MKERIRKPKDRSTEIIQSEKQKEEKKNEQILKELCDITECMNIIIMGVSEEKRERKGKNSI